MIEEKNNLENLRCEYSQVNQNYRHFNVLRLVAIGFYFFVFLITTLFFFQIIQASFISDWQRAASRAMGLFFTIAFLAFDIYCELSLKKLREIAVRLEEALAFQQFKELSLPHRAWLQYVLWGAYSIFLLYWLLIR